MKTEKEKVKIFENTQFAAELASYFTAVADVLNQVKVDFEALDIGEFTPDLIQAFITQGPDSIIEKYQSAFDVAAKDLPKIIRITLPTAPREEIINKFRDNYAKIQRQIHHIGSLAQSQNMQDRRIFNTMSARFDLITMNKDGVIEFTQESSEITRNAFTFWAESQNQLKILELGGKAEKLLKEIAGIVKEIGYPGDFIFSFPSDRHTGIFDFDGNYNAKFNPDQIRFIE